MLAAMPRGEGRALGEIFRLFGIRGEHSLHWERECCREGEGHGHGQGELRWARVAGLTQILPSSPKPLDLALYAWATGRAGGVGLLL